MKNLLMSATGSRTCGPPHCNMTFLKPDTHVLPSDPLMGPHGALVVQEDVARGLKVNEADSSYFFTIGVVRRARRRP